MQSDRPWLKIIFDSMVEGTAFIQDGKHKRPRLVPGRWVVFDKNHGVGGLKTYVSGMVLYDAATVEGCFDWIDSQESYFRMEKSC